MYLYNYKGKSGSICKPLQWAGLKSTDYISYCFSYFIYYIYNLEKTC